ncbi:50S ribosomal protein L21 [Candidatus Saccharibacteria bacterium RIFCSPHIGHO2_12_FULL_47_16b]|nr:MAG: 50S ribosomal protein L21 [Candidatus Saccharibacteria bacterium RIFCSPHIGHO2_12_FULL_47_16b]
MKKAVISTGGKQYLVAEGQELEVDKLKDEKKADFETLLLIDDEKINIGTPTISGVKVSVEIVEPEIKAEKIVAIRYKAKKRVHKRRGHRQRYSRIKIISIGVRG